MRPRNVDEIAGNDPAKKIIQSKSAQTMPKAILIHGNPGCGKTTLARIILFDILKGSEECIREINMGTKGGVDTAREIEDQVNWKPGIGPINGWILDECHKATAPAISALLKPTEDGSQAFNYFIFCTSDRNEFLKKLKKSDREAFLSRCMEIKVGPIDDKDGFNMIVDCLDELEITSDQIPDDVIEEILKVSEGVPRVMYKNLETIIGMKTQEDMIQHLQNSNYSTDEATPEMRTLFTHILKSEWKQSADFLSEMKKNKIDVETYRYPMMGYMLSVMLNPKTPGIGAEKAEYCINSLCQPLHEGRIYKFSTIVKKACEIGKQK